MPCNSTTVCPFGAADGAMSMNAIRTSCPYVWNEMYDTGYGS